MTPEFDRQVAPAPEVTERRQQDLLRRGADFPGRGPTPALRSVRKVSPGGQPVSSTPEGVASVRRCRPSSSAPEGRGSIANAVCKFFRPVFSGLLSGRGWLYG